ncbi:MAG: type II toxin-antitoxin system HicA family toxin [Opitutaceae bacterium]|jgi:predicted RNA binding protein YcfA (HicA-like mRNA interferase family)|nr:type II toxin-antitoxin system HicA family toxin [Opitutaceae bacterium]
MPKLPGLGQRDAVRALENARFRIIREGKHIIMGNGTVIVTIPRHTRINAFTMGNIAKTAGYTPREFLKLL